MTIEDDITELLGIAANLEKEAAASTEILELQKYSQAAVAYEGAASLAEHHLGAYSENTLKIRDQWASALRAARNLEAAITCNRINIERYKNAKSHGPRHYLTLDAQRRLAESCVQNAEYQEAIQVYRTVVDIVSKSETQIEQLCRDRAELAKALFESKEVRHVAEAVDFNMETLRIANEHFGEDHIESVTTRFNLARELYQLRKYQDATKYLEETQEILARATCKCRGDSEYVGLLEDTKNSLKNCQKRMRREEKKKQDEREAKAREAEAQTKAEAERRKRAQAEKKKIEEDRIREEAKKKDLELAELKRNEEVRVRVEAEQAKEARRRERKREEKKHELAKIEEQKRVEEQRAAEELETRRQEEQALAIARMEEEKREELKREQQKREIEILEKRKQEEEKRKVESAEEQRLEAKLAERERLQHEMLEKTKAEEVAKLKRSRERRDTELFEEERLAKAQDEHKLQQEQVEKAKVQQEFVERNRIGQENIEKASRAKMVEEADLANVNTVDSTNESSHTRTTSFSGAGQEPIDKAQDSPMTDQIDQLSDLETIHQGVEDLSTTPIVPTSPSTSMLSDSMTQGLMRGFRMISNATSKAAGLSLLGVPGYNRRTRSRSVGDVRPPPSLRAESPKPDKSTDGPLQQEEVLNQKGRDHRRSLQLPQPVPLFNFNRTDSLETSVIPGGWQENFDDGDKELRKARSTSNIFDSAASHHEAKPSKVLQAPAPQLYATPQRPRSRGEIKADEWFAYLECNAHAFLDKYKDYSDRSAKSRPVKIAILDTGVAKRGTSSAPVPPLIQQASKRLKLGKMVSKSLPPYEDTKGHGTHAAGLILTVCPYADVYVYRVLEGDEQLKHQLVTDAITDAIDTKKVDIVSMSFGWERNEDAGLRAVIDRARSQKVLLFAASSNHGNHTRGGMVYPARADGVIAVDAADGDGSPSKFNPPESHKPRFTALGEEVNSAWPTGLAEENDVTGWRRTSGTSCATPIAAAIAGLVLEFARQPPLCHDPRIEEHLKSLEGMRTVLSKLFSQKGTTFSLYQNLLPQLLFSCNERYPDGGEWHWTSSPRGIAATHIVACLQHEYGHDLGKPIDAKRDELIRAHS